jgi:hypothetical protein
MTLPGWTWAQLTEDQLQRVETAEQTLGADILLVYQPNPSAASAAGATQPQGLQLAPLTDSQLECLHGLEAQLQAVVVAYSQA